VGPDLFCVGEVTEGGGVSAIDQNGDRRPVEGVVNEHFASRIEDAGSFMDSIEHGTFVR